MSLCAQLKVYFFMHALYFNLKNVTFTDCLEDKIPKHVSALLLLRAPSNSLNCGKALDKYVCHFRAPDKSSLQGWSLGEC